MEVEQVMCQTADGPVQIDLEKWKTVSKTIQEMCEDTEAVTFIPLPKLHTREVHHINHYLQHMHDHADIVDNNMRVKKFAQEFEWFKLSPEELDDILMTADYLNIPMLESIALASFAIFLEERLKGCGNDYTKMEGLLKTIMPISSQFERTPGMFWGFEDNCYVVKVGDE
jgi:hypothetical protein